MKTGKKLFLAALAVVSTAPLFSQQTASSAPIAPVQATAPAPSQQTASSAPIAPPTAPVQATAPAPSQQTAGASQTASSTEQLLGTSSVDSLVQSDPKLQQGLPSSVVSDPTAMEGQQPSIDEKAYAQSPSSSTAALTPTQMQSVQAQAAPSAPAVEIAAPAAAAPIPATTAPAAAPAPATAAAAQPAVDLTVPSSTPVAVAPPATATPAAAEAQKKPEDQPQSKKAQPSPKKRTVSAKDPYFMAHETEVGRLWDTQIFLPRGAKRKHFAYNSTFFPNNLTDSSSFWNNEITWRMAPEFRVGKFGMGMIIDTSMSFVVPPLSNRSDWSLVTWDSASGAGLSGFGFRSADWDASYGNPNASAVDWTRLYLSKINYMYWGDHSDPFSVWMGSMNNYTVPNTPVYGYKSSTFDTPEYRHVGVESHLNLSKMPFGITADFMTNDVTAADLFTSHIELKPLQALAVKGVSISQLSVGTTFAYDTRIDDRLPDQGGLAVFGVDTSVPIVRAPAANFDVTAQFNLMMPEGHAPVRSSSAGFDFSTYKNIFFLSSNLFMYQDGNTPEYFDAGYEANQLSRYESLLHSTQQFKSGFDTDIGTSLFGYMNFYMSIMQRDFNADNWDMTIGITFPKKLLRYFDLKLYGEKRDFSWSGSVSGIDNGTNIIGAETSLILGHFNLSMSYAFSDEVQDSNSSYARDVMSEQGVNGTKYHPVWTFTLGSIR